MLISQIEKQQIITDDNISLKSWGILILLSIIWGSSFILIKKALIAFSPVDVACLRIGITSLAFAPFLIYLWKDIDWNKWKYFLLVGTTGSALPALLFAIAQTQVSSSMAGVLNSLTPLFTLILGYFLFKNKISKFQVLGILAGFTGASLLILGGATADISGNVIFGSLIIFATFCYAYNVNAINAFFKDTRPLIISAVSFSLLGPLALAYLACSGFYTQLTTHEYAYYSMASVTFLALFGTVLSTVLFFKLIKDTNPIFGSSVSYLIPIVALIWGLSDGEQLFIPQMIGMATILTGIYLIKKG